MVGEDRSHVVIPGEQPEIGDVVVEEGLLITELSP